MTDDNPCEGSNHNPNLATKPSMNVPWESHFFPLSLHCFLYTSSGNEQRCAGVTPCSYAEASAAGSKSSLVVVSCPSQEQCPRAKPKVSKGAECGTPHRDSEP